MHDAVTTPRLILRAFTEEDVEPMVRILGEKDVLRYFPKTDPPPRDRVQKMILGLLKHWQDHGYGLWAVESRTNGELMGRCGLQLLPEFAEVEVDFILGKPFWGQGFATEAGQASLRYGFEQLGLERIVGITHIENKASRRVLEKLGMEMIEQRQFWGIECYLYAIERSAYHRASACFRVFHPFRAFRGPDARHRTARYASSDPPVPASSEPSQAYGTPFARASVLCYNGPACRSSTTQVGG